MNQYQQQEENIHSFEDIQELEYFENKKIQEQKKHRRRIKEVIGIVLLVFALLITNIDTINHLLHPDPVVSQKQEEEEEIKVISSAKDYSKLYLFNKLPFYDPVLTIVVENTPERLVLDYPKSQYFDIYAVQSKINQFSLLPFKESTYNPILYEFYTSEGYHLIFKDIGNTFIFETPKVKNNHEWLNDDLGSHFPKIEGKKTLLINDSPTLHEYYFMNMDWDDFMAYTEKLKEAGFTDIRHEENYDFVAYDQNGYYVKMDYKYTRCVYVRFSNE